MKSFLTLADEFVLFHCVEMCYGFRKVTELHFNLTVASLVGSEHYIENIMLIFLQISP